MLALFDFLSSGDTSLYVCTAILIAVILGIAIPITIYEQRIVKRRWQTVSDFVEQHKEQIVFRPLELKQANDVLLPVFSGFLIHGHFSYICLDPAQDRAKVLPFMQKLREVCAANNSWHFDYFTSRFYAWLYYKRAIRAFDR
jgi:hypothetical protein